MMIARVITTIQEVHYLFSSRRRHTRYIGDWSSDVCSSDLSGRDMLSRIIYGARISVTVGFGAVAIATGLATIVGMASGYFGGWLDLAVQRVVDTWISFPALVLLISFVSVFGPGLWNITFILGVLLAPGASRVIRGATIAMRHQPYVEAARCLG